MGLGRQPVFSAVLHLTFPLTKKLFLEFCCSCFYCINPTDPRAWEIFPSSAIFLSFFLQRLKDFIIQVFLLFG